MTRTSTRRGAAMVAALVTLLIVSAIAGVLVKSLVHAQRQSRRDAWQMQAAWLADSALDRAVIQLRASDSFSGETWQPQVGSQSELQGSVHIEVYPVVNQPRQRKVVVEALVPNDAIQRAVARRELLITLPNPGDNP